MKITMTKTERVTETEQTAELTQYELATMTGHGLNAPLSIENILTSQN